MNLPKLSNMTNYHGLLRHIMDNGSDVLNKRTGVVCRFVTGAHLEFNMDEGFPAPTCKKFAEKSCTGELLGFFGGFDNAVDFEKVGTKVWYENANKTQGWLDNPFRKGENDLGPVYGVQWNAWRDTRVAHTEAERDLMLDRGFKQILEGKTPEGALNFVMERHINQLENALKMLLTNPSDRRIIVTGWNVADLDFMALPPCHMTYTFVANPDTKELDVSLDMRSWDTFLAFNIQLTAMFLEIMARLSGFKARKVIINASNAHAYDNQFDAIETMLAREHYPAPKLVLSDNIKPIQSLDEIPGVFKRITPEDIKLEGYLHHDPIKVKMVA